ncbi:MAG: radical SAM protein [Clostridiales bacterium]|nr:radical SAM protein [Clostridiales bacterium]
MNKEFNLEKYLTKGVEKIIKNAVKATIKNPAESIFMAKYTVALKKANEKRAMAEEKGEHIPPFLIASITSSCNLHCAGCYSRANHACCDCTPVSQLTSEEWKKVFLEARDIGIGFILLAGGEPMIRKDVIEIAGEIPEILFPIFTNGTLIDDAYIKLLDQHRNLVPIVSIEGREEATDNRRGAGVYQRAIKAMACMKDNGIIFGASITVTTENIKEVTSDTFLAKLEEHGCKVVFYVEFVPVIEVAAHLAPGDYEREYLKTQLEKIRVHHDEMVFISFPGDEKSSGGCLAAGRGFFHINSHGGAEPCPFSPYSDINVKDSSLREVLKSKLFLGLRDGNVLMEEHSGGCVLFERKEQVEALFYG